MTSSYRIKITDAAKLQDEYAKLVEGLQETTEEDGDTDGFMANPRTSHLRYIFMFGMLTPLSVLPDDLLKEAVPGNIRKAEHFVAFLKRFVEYLKVFDPRYCSFDSHTHALQSYVQTRMRVLHVVAETPLSFLQHLKDITYIERRPLRQADLPAQR